MRRTLVLKRDVLSELTPKELANVVGGALRVITLDEDCNATRTGTRCIPTCMELTCGLCDG